MRTESVAKLRGKNIEALEGGGVSKKRVGASGDGGDQETEAVPTLGNLLLLPLP